MGLVEEDKTIQDLVIPGIEKQKFRINGDNDKILELNTSDANILTRLAEGYESLVKLTDEIQALGSIEPGKDTEEDLDKMSKAVASLDKKMRDQLDYIFDSNVSEVCAGNGSMIDPSNGKFRWEHIIETLGNLYEKSFTEEFEKMSKNINARTKKYTGRKKK